MCIRDRVATVPRPEMVMTSSMGIRKGLSSSRSGLSLIHIYNDYIEQAAPGFKITAHTVNCPVAAAENAEKGLYAVQFLSLIHILRR